MPVARATGRTLLRAGRLLTAALVALVVAAGLTAGAPRAEAATPPPASSFVQRTGSGLTLAGAPFRFSGTNVYWLGLDDNVRDAAGAPTYPTRFRVDDAFRAAQAAGDYCISPSSRAEATAAPRPAGSENRPSSAAIAPGVLRSSARS